MKELKKVTIVTHEKFHIDEAVAILLLMHFGNRIGIKATNLEFVSESSYEIDPHKIYIGIGGGELDEHIFNGDFRNKGKSTVMLVAEKLEIKDSNYMSLVKHAHNNDLHGASEMTELGNILKEKFNQGQKETDVFSFVHQVLLQKLNSLEEKSEFKKLAKEIKGERMLTEKISKNIDLRPKSIKRFVLRKHFSINDVVAVRAMQVFGKKFLVNSSKPEQTRIDFFEEYNYIPRKGDLVIGFGNDFFGMLPALKMFDFLNIKKDGKFKLLLHLINNLNKSSGYHPWGIQGLLIDRFLNKENSSYSNFIFAMKELNLLIRKQQRFLDAKREIQNGFKNKKSITLFAGSKKVGVFHTNNNLAASVAFNELKCDLVILKNDIGQVFIQTKADKKGNRIDISGIVFKIRLEEMLKDGYRYEELDLKILSKEGTITECLEWYYHKPVQALLNGGTTHSGVPPTKLTLKKIINIVVHKLKEQ